MSCIQILLCLFSVSATLLINQVEARLSGEGIIGGDYAEEGQIPYQINLEVLSKNICGGSILSEGFIITAAHCVIHGNGSFMGYPIKVIGGVTNLKFKTEHRVAVDVVKVYIPKEYDPTVKRSHETGDIAILKLNENLDIEGNPNLGKVELPKDETYEGKEAIISGFGWNSVKLEVDPYKGSVAETGGHSFKKMRYAQTNVLSNKECQAHYREPIYEKHICAAVVQRDHKNPEGVCSGDSGGPLVYEGAQIGVVSTSPLGCSEKHAPAVYTRVSKFIDFIAKVVSNKIDDDIRVTTLKVKA